MDGRLTVATLGPLRAFAGEQEIVLGPPKQRAVFAILTLRANNVVSRDDLVDSVWGESPPATAAGSLHTYVSGLRRALSGVGEPLTSSRTGYVLRLDPGRLDIRVVERLTGQARESRARQDLAAAATAYAEALAHWRPGAALSGLPGPVVAGYQTRMSDLRLQLLLEHAEARLELHEPATVVEQLWEHIRDNPHHERLRALLMTALRQSNRTADALAQYHDLRKRLADDLGIDPSAELQALYAAILTDNAATPTAAATTPAPPATLPAGLVRPAEMPRGVGHFVGRVASVRQVLDTAGTTAPGTGRDPSPQIAMIVGVGGVGKTALAVHCAHQLAADYPDGQLYVNLRGFDPRQPARSPTDALHHLLTSVGAEAIPADHDRRVALWRSVVRDRRLLIVLDNAERADQVEDLLPGGSPSFVVVTSRNRLSALAVRYGARRVTLSPFTAEESLHLLAGAISGAQVEAEPVAARQLADLCGHLPLALRIAAEQVSLGTRSRIGDVVADLQDVRHRLDGLQIPDDELYSVRGVLSWSYARLDAAASHAFRMLGLFPGVNIGVHAAAALLDVPRQAAVTALRTLADQHLLETTGDTYWMHDLTRIYAQEIALDGDCAAAHRPALERVLRWYIRTLAKADGRASSDWFPIPSHTEAPVPLHLADKNAFMAWCAREWDNIAALLRTGQRIGCHEQVWQLAYLSYPYFYTAGQIGEWLETLRIGLRSAELVANRRAHGGLLNLLGMAYSRLGQHDAAVQQLQRILSLLEPGDHVQRVIALSNLAACLLQAKRYDAALRHARQTHDLATRWGPDDYLESSTLEVLCALHAVRGEFDEALRYGRQGLPPARRCHNTMSEANILIHLGVASHGLGDTATALGHFQDALAVCESSGDRYHEALALFHLAKVHRAGSDPRTARQLADQALQRFRELDSEEVADVTAFLQELAVG